MTRIHLDHAATTPLAAAGARGDVAVLDDNSGEPVVGARVGPGGALGGRRRPRPDRRGARMRAARDRLHRVGHRGGQPRDSRRARALGRGTRPAHGGERDRARRDPRDRAPSRGDRRGRRSPSPAATRDCRVEPRVGRRGGHRRDRAGFGHVRQQRDGRRPGCRRDRRGRASAQPEDAGPHRRGAGARDGSRSIPTRSASTCSRSRRTRSTAPRGSARSGSATGSRSPPRAPAAARSATAEAPPRTWRGSSGSRPPPSWRSGSAPRRPIARRRSAPRLVAAVDAQVPGAIVTAAGARKAAGFATFAIPGVRSDVLLAALDMDGVEASAGSACGSGAPLPSHVLRAMGYPDELAAGGAALHHRPLDHRRGHRCRRRGDRERRGEDPRPSRRCTRPR